LSRDVPNHAHRAPTSVFSAMTKALDIWLPAWLRREKHNQHTLGTRHVIIAICDHYEPFHGVGKTEAVARVETWQRDFPKLIEEFRDSDGVSPRHTFFYPIEQYDSEIIGRIADLCAVSGSETEIHLHHDNDTAENLRRVLELGVERFAGHG